MQAGTGTRTRENSLAVFFLLSKGEFPLKGSFVKETVGVFYSAGERSSRCAIPA